MKDDKAFGLIPIPERSNKPREAGLTMLIDLGMGLNVQEDLTNAWRDYIDIAKIAVGYSRLYPESYLKKKIDLYNENDIDTCPGGMFLELAVKQGNVKAFFEEAKKIGFQSIEVSDNLEKIPSEKKIEFIRQAREQYGFKVFGEVGRKGETSSPQEIVDDLTGCLKAGAWKVYVEAYELFVEGFNQPLFDQLTASVPLEKIIFEMPSVYFPGIHYYDHLKLFNWLIVKFGVDVNIGNVLAEQIPMVEAIRRGIMIDAANPAGAYRLAGFSYSENKDS